MRLDDPRFQKCAVCSRQDDVDFHHWDYQTNQGVYLCRECHEFIHADLSRPSEGEGEEWITKAIPRLLKRHDRHNEDNSIQHVMSRYNIPDEYRGIVKQPRKFYKEVDEI